MPVDPRPPIGGLTATPVSTPAPAVPAPALGAGAATASDFASVMALLRADLAAGAVLTGAPPAPARDDATPPAIPPVAAAAVDPAAIDSAVTDPALTDPAPIDPAAADPIDLRGMDGRDRTRQFVHRGPAREAPGDEAWLLGADGLTVDDLIDVINPLQHIPVVSTLYRWITGDEMSPAANMAGGALFGGPLGFVAALANEVVADASGRDPGESALAMVLGGQDGAPGAAGGGPADGAVAVAAAPMARFSIGRERAGAPTAAPTPIPVPPNVARAAPPNPDHPAGPSLAALPAPAAAVPGGFQIAIAQPGAEAAFIPLDGSAAGHLPAIGRAAAASPPPNSPGLPTIPAAAVPQRMMQALEKYEALNRARDAGDTGPDAAPAFLPGAGGLVDATL